jgi:hypothetical protein
VTITESRLDNGTLKLGPTGTGQLDMSCQLTNVVVTSAYDDDGDPVTTLCGDSKPAPRKLNGRKLEGTFIQDFDDPTGIVAYVWDNDLDVVDFEYVPDDATTGPTLTGTVMLEVPESTYGGDVGSRLTSDFSWNIQGELTRTYPTTP